MLIEEHVTQTENQATDALSGQSINNSKENLYPDLLPPQFRNAAGVRGMACPSLYRAKLECGGILINLQKQDP